MGDIYLINRVSPHERKPREFKSRYGGLYNGDTGRACHRTINGRGVVGRLVDRHNKRLRGE